MHWSCIGMFFCTSYGPSQSYSIINDEVNLCINASTAVWLSTLIADLCSKPLSCQTAIGTFKIHELYYWYVWLFPSFFLPNTRWLSNISPAYCVCMQTVSSVGSRQTHLQFVVTWIDDTDHWDERSEECDPAPHWRNRFSFVLLFITYWWR